MEIKQLSTQGAVSVRVLIHPQDCEIAPQADHASSSDLTAQRIGLKINNITAEIIGVFIPNERIEAIARRVHSANAAIQRRLGEETPAFEAVRESVVNGIRQIFENPETTPADSHANWLAFKEAEGWVYGEVKDFDAKTHPCMVPYDELPAEQREKDDVFQRVVRRELDKSRKLSITFFSNHGWVIHSGFMREPSEDESTWQDVDGFIRQSFMDRDGSTYYLKVPDAPTEAEFDIVVEAEDAHGNRYVGRRRCQTTPESNDRSVQVWVSRQ